MNLDLPPLDGALCAEVDPELWFPEKGGRHVAPRAICRQCPVFDDCLDDSLRWYVYGIWADTSEVERREIRQALGIRPKILGFNTHPHQQDDPYIDNDLPQTAQEPAMTTATQPSIDFMNSSWDEIAQHLQTGKSPREISDLVSEPLGNVMGVWKHLRDAGQAEARNFAAPATPAAPPAFRPATTPSARPVQQTGQPTAPRHTPDPALAQRIADSTDLLVKAASIDDKRIQGALGRARKAMVDLAGLVENYESKAAARHRIARLEAELRIAKAELRDKPASAAASGGETGAPKRELSEAQQAALIKMREKAAQPVDCPDCGKTMGNKAGLSAHQRGGKCVPGNAA